MVAPVLGCLTAISIVVRKCSCYRGHIGLSERTILKSRVSQGDEYTPYIELSPFMPAVELPCGVIPAHAVGFTACAQATKRRLLTFLPNTSRKLFTTRSRPWGKKKLETTFHNPAESTLPPSRVRTTVLSLSLFRLSCANITGQGFGHAVYCARHALGVEDHERNGGAAARKSGDFESPENDREGEGAAAASNGVGAEAKDAESFLLVLGDHLYRRGAGTTQACASQLIHAFLEHGEAGKPAIGLKVGVPGMEFSYRKFVEALYPPLCPVPAEGWCRRH